jgi:glucose-6-phosphate isomerase
MSVIRPRLPEDPILHEAVDPDGQPWGSGDAASRLEAIRAEILANPAAVDLPRRLLAEYGTRRPESRLFAILAEARRIRDAVDRLVIVASGGIGPATRLLVASCCHPFHNELPRGERGGRPRLTWLDSTPDNDRIQGLLDLVAPEGRPRSRDLLDQWALLAVEAAPDDQATLATARMLAAALEKTTADEGSVVPHRIVAVARAESPLAEWAGALGCPVRFQNEPEMDAAQGVFTAASLLPAAIAGINVVRLLEGASAMLVRFTEAPVALNPALVDAACRDRVLREAGIAGSVFDGGGPALSDLSAWVRHVRQVPLGAATVVTRVTIGESRRACFERPPMAVVPEPKGTISIQLPRLDEHALGQLLQLVILSAAVEQRLRESV